MNLRDRARRAAAAALCVPPAVLLHEIGHWVGYLMAGLAEPTLHYASSGFRDQPAFWTAVRAGDLAQAEAIGSVAGAGVAAFLGIAMTWGLMLGGAWLVRHPALRVTAAAMVIASAVRFVPVGLFLFRGAAEHTDEAHVAQALAMPMLLPALVVLGIGLAIGSIVAAGRALPTGERGRLMADITAGVVAGTVAWLGFVGPALLP